MKIEQENLRSPPAMDCLDFNLTEETMDCVVEDHDQTTRIHMFNSSALSVPSRGHYLRVQYLISTQPPP